jgi:hypothetical protein
MMESNDRGAVTKAVARARWIARIGPETFSYSSNEQVHYCTGFYDYAAANQKVGR